MADEYSIVFHTKANARSQFRLAFETDVSARIEVGKMMAEGMYRFWWEEESRQVIAKPILIELFGFEV